MTTGSELYARMRASSGGLVITVRGELIDYVDTSALTAPTLLVSPVSEALKEVSPDGLVLRHIDREIAWRVDAYYLDDATSHMLGSEEVEIGRIHQRVSESGRSWQARPIEDVS